MDPHSAYKKYRIDKRMSPRGIMMTPIGVDDREAYRKQMTDEIRADIQLKDLSSFSDCIYLFEFLFE